jgi:peptide/nickel transport system permease protein
VEVLSLLDLAVAPLRLRTEKTYSAPLAARLFARETVERSDGRQERIFPRLTHGGAHLRDPETEKARDIALRAVAGVLAALLAWGMVVMGFLAVLACRHKQAMASLVGSLFRGKEEIPWNAALWTLLALLLAAVPAVVLSLKYHVLGTDRMSFIWP